jgi:hypothetical protein
MKPSEALRQIRRKKFKSLNPFMHGICKLYAVIKGYYLSSDMRDAGISFKDWPEFGLLGNTGIVPNTH